MDQARLLLDIQEADIELTRLEKRLAEMPEKRGILEARKRIKDIQELEGRTDAFISQIEAVVARDEDGVSSISEKMNSEQAKLLSGKITNPKEVQHISNELEMLRRNKDEAENAILEQMEKRELALEQRAKVTAAREAAEAKEAALVEGFKGKGGSLQDEIQTVSARRETSLAGLDAPIRELYERHRAARAGVIVGVLRGSTCGACRVELPAETVHELVSGESVSECPLCRRILLVGVDVESTDEES